MKSMKIKSASDIKCPLCRIYFLEKINKLCKTCETIQIWKFNKNTLKRSKTKKKKLNFIKV
jgi:hypothetical protein